MKMNVDENVRLFLPPPKKNGKSENIISGNII